jgi:ABC-2 type transport system permease protein
MMRFFRSAFVIARRDFSATVLSKAFIFFLLAPLFPLLFGGVFSSISARVASQNHRPVIAVVGDQADIDALAAAREQVARAVGDDDLVALVGYRPETDLASQQKHLLATPSPPIRAVLSGGLAHPQLAGGLANDSNTIGQLQLIISSARAGAVAHEPQFPIHDEAPSSGALNSQRTDTAQIAQTILFILTLMLSTMVLSQLIEEKSNKVIEVIAAAIPIDAMFVGKLFAMLSASILALLVWMGCGALLIQFVKHGGVATLPVPAVGWPLFLALSVIYFGMNYLLFGAAFLMIGAQASTAREVQTMSLPATFAQVLLFGFAAGSVGNPDSLGGIAAAVFPLSSPMAMIARAAEDARLWPHLAGIAWQAVWIAVILRFGAQLFRKTVLKSGPRRPWWRFGRA